MKLENHYKLYDVPVFVCGDMNARPKDSAIHMMMNKTFSVDKFTGR